MDREDWPLDALLIAAVLAAAALAVLGVISGATLGLAWCAVAGVAVWQYS